jgi:uncharacterized protein involved in response to NO
VSRVVLSRGFRLFFLFGALNAFASMVPWLWVLAGGAVPTQGWSPHTLHAHELLYGTVVPAIAGFLLTAVPNWTQTAPVVGARLAGLLALWLAGRVALVLAGPVAPGVVATVDVAFLPVLAVVVGLPILRARRPRNLPVVGVLVGLAAANAAIHFGLQAQQPAVLRAGTFGAVYLVVVLMLVISGRIVPLFTRNALERQGVTAAVSTPRAIGAAALAAAVTALALDLATPRSEASAWVALAAAPLLLARQGGWQPMKVTGQPMLWILHLGHAWIALGFALHGMSVLSGWFVGAGALHAFTAGAMGTLILGVMPRVALGHTGRAIVASRATVAMFGLVISGALLRVVGASTAGPLYQPAVIVGGSLWSAAWLVFCVAYGKVLLGPRVDEP